MCGVAGVISYHDADHTRLSIERMLKLIKHRGPDGSGIELFHLSDQANLALGHNRLAIIDTSSAGLMPMASDCKNLSIIFNGEIFNYIELRDELISLGHIFNTLTDTEVLLKAYIEWGSECLNKLNGMFAFAIFDKKSEELFIARDRYGIKPLYYCYKENFFIFASEIKSILSHEDINTTPNENEIGKFILTGVINDTELTCFKGINSLKPGHWLRYSTNNVSIEKWYLFDQENKLASSADIKYKDAVIGLKDIFQDAVRLRLRSDVEVGACLSGGLDSSSIVGAVAKIRRAKNDKAQSSFKTFSSIYDDPSISEKEYVDHVTKFTETENFSFTPQLSNFWNNISSIVWHNDEPIQTPTAFNQWSVMVAAKKESIKVTLDGQGVDELAAGYPTYYSVYLAELIRNFDLFSFFSTLKKILSSEGEGRSLIPLIVRTLYLLIPIPLLRILLTLPYLRFALKGSALLPFIKKDYKNSWISLSKEQFFSQRLNSLSLKKRLRFDFYKISLPALLRYEDRSSMASSIEARTPFLDYRFVEYLQKLPSKFFIKEGLTKAIVRDGVSDFVPQSVFNRTDKKGYPIPSSLWLKESREHIDRLFSKECFVFLFFDAHKLKKALLSDDLVLGNDLFWRIIFTELWFQEFFEINLSTKKITKNSKFNMS